MRLQILLAVFLIAICTAVTAQDAEYAYYCPPCNAACDDIKFEKEGRCPHCNMRLLKQTAQEREGTMQMRNMTIGFYLQDGVEVLDFAGPMEVFAYAGFNVLTITKDGEPITSQGILKVVPDHSIANAPPVDVLAFFGGGAAGRVSRDAEILAWIKGQEQVQYHFSVCTGAFFLGEAGLLDGNQATTFHSAIEHLRERFPKATVLSDVRYVDNGTVITTAGISAGIDGALHFVQKFAGEDTASRIAENMEYDKWRPNEGLVVKNNQ